MNASKLMALFVAISVMAPSFAEAGQPLGPPKARGDFRPYWEANRSVARSITRSRPVYRYSAPQSAPVIVRSAPVIHEEEGAIIAQAPVEARRFSQAPAAENAPAVQPAPTTSSAGRRYSYAPSTGSPMRSYSGNVGRSSQPTWSLPKTDPRKFNAR
jgi:hypothetical protein